MPVRKRKARTTKDALSMERFVYLSIGPMPHERLEDLPMDMLERVFRRNRKRLPADCWAARYFDEGVDDRGPVAGADQAGLSGRELDLAVGLPGAGDPSRRP